MGNPNLDLQNMALFKTIDTNNSGWIDAQEEDAFNTVIKGARGLPEALIGKVLYDYSQLPTTDKLDSMAALIVAKDIIKFQGVNFDKDPDMINAGHVSEADKVRNKDFIDSGLYQKYTDFFAQFKDLSKVSQFIDDLNQKYCKG